MKFIPPEKLPVEHLSIGECIFTSKNVFVSTVLGSCVSVTFFHPASNYAGMFHAMLPDGGFSKDKSIPCNFADVAINSILARFKSKGVRVAELEVKLFGGANTFVQNENSKMRDILDVGKKNVESARRSLLEYGLCPKVENVLGAKGRKIIFNTSTGEVWMKFL